MVFSSKKDENIKLLLDNTEIKKVQSCKYLCIYIDDELNWKVHIYPRRARSALGVDTVLTSDVCMYVCMYVCLYVC